MANDDGAVLRLRNSPVLILLIVVNIGVFLAMAFAGDSFTFSARTLSAWGGNLGALSLHGEYWRLLTAPFLHVNVAHILGNMALLAIAGSYLERRIGPTRFLLAYALCGVMAGVLSAYGHPYVVGVGASGAIAGIVGIIVVLYFSGQGEDISGTWVAQTIGINALYSLAPNVDWIAHVGGFVTGLIVAAGLIVSSAVRRET